MSDFMFNAKFTTYTSNMYLGKKIVLIRTQLCDKLMSHFCNIYIYMYLMLIYKTFIMKFVVPLAFSIKNCGWKWNKFNHSIPFAIISL